MDLGEQRLSHSRPRRYLSSKALRDKPIPTMNIQYRGNTSSGFDSPQSHSEWKIEQGWLREMYNTTFLRVWCIWVELHPDYSLLTVQDIDIQRGTAYSGFTNAQGNYLPIACKVIHLQRNLKQDLWHRNIKQPCLPWTAKLPHHYTSSGFPANPFFTFLVSVQTNMCCSIVGEHIKQLFLILSSCIIAWETWKCSLPFCRYLWLIYFEVMFWKEVCLFAPL